MAVGKEELQELLQKELPGERAHLAMYPKRAATSIALKTAENVRMSAVAIVLFNGEKGLTTLVIRRQEYEGAHSGQISFPGGKWEDTDASLEATARREFEEEIGIPGSELELAGKLTNVFVQVSNFLIEPYVFFWPEPHFDFSAAEREVAAIHLLPVTVLTDESIELVDIVLPHGGKLLQTPHFNTGEVMIWGATALILNELREVIGAL
jgi:8-oxo-dGTP pyrophosphatase MutT (NUDIX family)